MYKNNSNRLLFVNLGIPSHPIVIITRWFSCLRVAMYYSEHLPKITEIINTVENDDILIWNAKDALSKFNVFHFLFQIKTFYQSLINFMDGFENSAYKTGYNQLINLNLIDDPCEIKDYILNRLQKQDIMGIIILETWIYLQQYMRAFINAMWHHFSIVFQWSIKCSAKIGNLQMTIYLSTSVFIITSVLIEAVIKSKYYLQRTIVTKYVIIQKFHNNFYLK